MFADMPASVSFKKLRKRLVRNALQVIDHYGLVDRTSDKRPKWLVCLSGGKDSYGLLSILLDLQWQGALPVDLLACNLDQGQPGFPKHVLPEWLDKTGVPYRIETEESPIRSPPTGLSAPCARVCAGVFYTASPARRAATQSFLAITAMMRLKPS